MVIGDFDVDPIFGRQNSAQFLIDPTAYKPTEVNAILGAFGGTEKLEHGKKEANLRKTQKDAEARTIATQIRDAEERKALLALMQTEGQAVSDALHRLERTSASLRLKPTGLRPPSGFVRESSRCVRLWTLSSYRMSPDWTNSTGLVLTRNKPPKPQHTPNGSETCRSPLQRLDSLERRQGLWNQIAAVKTL